jgi:hypothetical protein
MHLSGRCGVAAAWGRQRLAVVLRSAQGVILSTFCVVPRNIVRALPCALQTGNTAGCYDMTFFFEKLHALC